MSAEILPYMVIFGTKETGYSVRVACAKLGLKTLESPDLKSLLALTGVSKAQFNVVEENRKVIISLTEGV